MNILCINKNNFIDYFISKEKKLLLKINSEAYYNKDFKFYMEWFIYAIDDYIKEKYDIEERFSYLFMNNFSLNIIFFTYITNQNFIDAVINDIEEYKEKYGKEYIY